MQNACTSQGLLTKTTISSVMKRGRIALGAKLMGYLVITWTSKRWYLSTQDQVALCLALEMNVAL